MTRARRNQLVAASVILVIILLTYGLVPAVHGAVTAAAALLSRADVTPVKEYILGFGAWGPVIAFGLHFLASVAAPLPNFVVTFAVAMVYGWQWGSVISWTACMLSAGVCFLVGRIYGRPVVEKAVPSAALAWFDRFFGRYGNHSVLIARLIPVVSFDFISYGAGLTNMSLWTFLIYTGLGMLPATVVYSYLAARGASSVIWLLYAFIVVGVLAAVAAAVRPLFDRRRAGGSGHGVTK